MRVYVQIIEFFQRRNQHEKDFSNHLRRGNGGNSNSSSLGLRQQQFVNGNGYGEVTITIKDNAITACEFKTYEENGTLKDENYGMVDGEIKNQDYYNKAQKAIKGSEEYAKKIIGRINPEDVDSISGATYSYNQFTDAVYDALDKAAE